MRPITAHFSDTCSAIPWEEGVFARFAPSPARGRRRVGAARCAESGEARSLRPRVGPAMPSFQHVLRELAETFARSVLDAVRGAPLRGLVAAGSEAPLRGSAAPPRRPRCRRPRRLRPGRGRPGGGVALSSADDLRHRHCRRPRRRVAPRPTPRAFEPRSFAPSSGSRSELGRRRRALERADPQDRGEARDDVLPGRRERLSSARRNCGEGSWASAQERGATSEETRGKASCRVEERPRRSAARSSTSRKPAWPRSAASCRRRRPRAG